MKLLKRQYLFTAAAIALAAEGMGLFTHNNPQIQTAVVNFFSSSAFAGQGHGGNTGGNGPAPGHGNPGPNGGGSGTVNGNGQGNSHGKSNGDGGSQGDSHGKSHGDGKGDNPCPPDNTPSPPSPPSPPSVPSPPGGGAPLRPSDWVNCEGSYTHLFQVLAHHYGMAPQEYTAWLRAQNGISEHGRIPPDVAYGAWKKAFPHWNDNMCETWDPIPWVQMWHPHATVTIAPVLHAHALAASSRKPFQLWVPSLGSLY